MGTKEKYICIYWYKIILQDFSIVYNFSIAKPQQWKLPLAQ